MPSQSEKEIKYWFPAKKYGWGWGLPTAWQGWLIMVLYICLIISCVYFFPPDNQSVLFFLSVTVLTVLLIIICLIKGEPPKWRWGKN